MQLEQSRAALRIRGGWESIDLGFKLAQRWFLPLWCIWMFTALPLFCLLHLILHDYLWVASLVVWWFKPLYEAPMVAWVGNSLFAQPQPVRPFMRQSWRHIKKCLFRNLTWRRLNPYRAYELPVQQLEQLTGKPLSQRNKVLHTVEHKSAWLLIICLHFEWLITYGFVGLVFLFYPNELQNFNWVSLITRVADNSFIELISSAFSLISMSIIAPFFICAGFATYINTRTQLEAWDIDIAFTHIAQKHERKHQQKSRESVRKTAAGTILPAMFVVFALTLFFASSGKVLANETGDDVNTISIEEAKNTIERVLERDVFGKKVTKTRWVKKDRVEEHSDTDWAWLESLVDFLSSVAQVIKYLAWLLLACLIGWLLYLLRHQLPFFRWPRLRTETIAPAGAARLLDEENNPLPADIPLATREALDSGQYRQAISLLYRGAIRIYLLQKQVLIPDSATEGECLRIVNKQTLQAEEHSFFQQLTTDWTKVAYGRFAPDANSVEALFDKWRDFYISQTASGTDA